MNWMGVWVFSTGLLCLLEAPVRAQSDVANCSRAREQQAQAKDLGAAEARLNYISALVKDFGVLIPLLNSSSPPVPMSLLRNCLQLKKEAFRTAIEMAPESVRSQSRFKLSMA